ncbi:hypothetical protein EFO75_05195 [Limosilactobacillus reuteri]|uniref:OB-fold protein n=1 Tax=Limosilactobacillus reuteri TaxID=1598 RepID=UPI0021A5FF5E|nr:hypothetical protein [Limosilactobacillus reuteri]MCT3208062.1 hypothetical protein [Limosilactobacillus reuteri]MCT3216661.1 hypothetical protein [Limosilactobacillus reuteri]
MEVLENIFGWIFLIAFIFMLVFGVMWFRVRKDKANVKYAKNKKYTLISLAVFIVSFIGFQVTPASDTEDDTAEAKTEQTSSKKESSSSESKADESSTAESSSSITYEQTTYDNLARHSEDWKGKNITITGQVTDVDKSDGNYELLVAINGDSDQLVMVRANKSYKPASGEVLENDLVTIKGTASGMKTYETVMAGDNTVPLIKSTATIEDQGKAPEDYGEEY